MNINDSDIKKAGEVANFMISLHKIDRKRYDDATEQSIPHGDLAYGQALVHWIKEGKPKSAIFSYADGEIECPLLMAFREEISAQFGLPILTREEAGIWRANQNNIKTHKVVDWLN